MKQQPIRCRAPLGAWAGGGGG
ncbi:MAG: hypothetical protein RLZZ395_218, partial [Pseudomonadota bacterium]